LAMRSTATRLPVSRSGEGPSIYLRVCSSVVVLVRLAVSPSVVVFAYGPSFLPILSSLVVFLTKLTYKTSLAVCRRLPFGASMARSHDSLQCIRGHPIVKENKIHTGDVGVLVLSGGKGIITENDIYNMMAEGVVIKGHMTGAGDKRAPEGSAGRKSPKSPKGPNGKEDGKSRARTRPLTYLPLHTALTYYPCTSPATALVTPPCCFPPGPVVSNNKIHDGFGGILCKSGGVGSFDGNEIYNILPLITSPSP
jgi:hypothetical protein